MTSKKTDGQKNEVQLLSKGHEAAKTASFYGFYPISKPSVTKTDIDNTKDLDPSWCPEERAALLRNFGESRNNYNIPQPVMVVVERPFKGSSYKHKAGKVECELSVLHSNKSITEALIIQAGRAILEQMGWKNTEVRLNSIGNKDSISEFERKMNNFIRKKISDLPADIKQKLKKDIFYLARTKDEKLKEWKDMIPQSLDCLNEASRLHLKEILEFLEIMEIPYAVDSSLVGDTDYMSETIFEIISEEGETLAYGYRWNRLSKKMQHKREIGAVSLMISAKPLKTQKEVKLGATKPQFYLVQFGPEAKLKSFLVLEKLRKVGVSILHSLAKDKLVSQMLAAEQQNIPYIILIGQKEALDNSVVIRNTSTRSQAAVSIENIGEYIKNMY